MSAPNYNEWFRELIHEVYPSEPGMLNIGLLNKRIAEKVKQDTKSLMLDLVDEYTTVEVSDIDGAYNFVDYDGLVEEIKKL